MSAPHHFTHTGRFYLGRNDKQQQIVLHTPAGNVSAIWDEDEAPYDDTMLPSEVSQILRQRIDSFLFMSDRAEKMAILDSIDARSKEFDRAFLLSRAKRLQAQAADLHKKVAYLLDAVADLETEMEEEGIQS